MGGERNAHQVRSFALRVEKIVIICALSISLISRPHVPFVSEMCVWVCVYVCVCVCVCVHVCVHVCARASV